MVPMEALVSRLYRTIMEYNALSRLTKTTLPSGSCTRLLAQTDTVGNLTWTRDPGDIETSYTYTDDYHVDRIVKAGNSRVQVQTFSWDSAGNRISASTDYVSDRFNLNASGT
jgi:YD repeat-containing protein